MKRAAALLALLALAPCPATAQGGWLSRGPLARTIAALTSPDAEVRRSAADQLSRIGPHDAVIEPLRIAMEHEAVPETLGTMVRAIARRAEASDVALLAAAWDRASIADRAALVGALDAIGDDAARVQLRTRLASEGAARRACDALTRDPVRLAWLAGTLEDETGRDEVVACLASAPSSDARDAALSRAGLDLSPAHAAAVLAALSESAHVDERALALAVAALSREDATLVGPALALLSRHAPARLEVARWIGFVDAPGDRGASAIRALLSLGPARADEALARAREAGGETARLALEVLSDRSERDDLERIAAFVGVEATRQVALDTLARREGGAEVLARLAPAPDVDVALALAHPRGAALEVLRAREPSRVLRAIAGDLEPDDWRADAAVDERRAAALCLVLAQTPRPDLAARVLETERDPSTVAWLAIAAEGQALSAQTLGTLLDADATRPAGLSLAAASLRAATPRDRRALEARVVGLARDADPVVRAEALRALGALGRAAHRGTVVRGLEDPAIEVRIAAARALAPLGLDPALDHRARGRARIETDPRVRAALAGVALPRAALPLHVRVRVHDPSLAAAARVEVRLADGRSLVLGPVAGLVVVPDVPEAPATVHLRLAPEAGRH